MEASRRCWIVEGKVQGVSFRAFVRRHAQRLGLVGFAENLPDGTVRVCALGDDKALATLRLKLAAGPRRARVRAVHAVTPIPNVVWPQEKFEIR